MYRLFTVSIYLLIVTTLHAQPQTTDVWSLERAIQYARDNNISIKQSALDKRLYKLRQTQTQLSQAPNINAGGIYGKSYGRSINPVSNEFVDAGYKFVGLSGNADVLLFGWFQKRNNITRSRLEFEAMAATYDQLNDDVSLNVLTGYLRILLANDQVMVNERQVALSKTQMDQVNAMVAQGVVPDLNEVQIEAQLAADSANLLASIATYRSSVLEMKALLNLDLNAQFTVAPLDTNKYKDAKLPAMNADQIYEAADNRLGMVRSSNYKLEAAKKSVWAAKGALLPQLGATLITGSNYTSLGQSFVPTGNANIMVAGSYVDVNGNQYPIYQNTPVYDRVATPFGDQINTNYRSTIGLTLTIPIFNAWQGMYNVKAAKINMQNAELNKYNVELKLKQGVYQTYQDVQTGIQTYYAARKSAEAARKSYYFASERYKVGLTNTVEYLVVQNYLYTAEFRLLSARYDLILKQKMIDYYVGNPLKL